MYDKLKRVIEENKHIVFFGGAGVSTESNIPDFRSQSGIYSKKTYPYPAETMISHDFFYEHTEAFYDFYFHEMVYPNAQPNPAHLALAKLEALGKLDAVITQNIDGLHQKARLHRVRLVPHCAGHSGAIVFLRKIIIKLSHNDSAKSLWGSFRFMS